MSNIQNDAGACFKAHFEKITEELPYDKAWENGTGYFDPATKLALEPGKMVKSRSLKGRRIILIGTRFGTVVVFDRYTEQDDGGVYVNNIPCRNNVFKSMIKYSEGAIDGDGMTLLLGEEWSSSAINIGKRIELMAEELAA